MKSSNWSSLSQAIRGIGRSLAVAPILLLAAVGSQNQLHAQTTADIVGTVTDTTGAVVPGASLTAVNEATKEEHKAVSQSTGDFTFTLLDPGVYDIHVTQNGFKAYAASGIKVAAGDRPRVNIMLQPGAVTEQISVTAETPALQTDNSMITNAVTERAVQDLPLNGRNYINLVQITPGANEGPPTGLSSGSRPDDRRQSSSISVNGQSDVMNNQMIDGMDNNERIIGTIGVRPSIDAIAELRVLTNSYEAEFGRTGGGVIDIITKQGTNLLHGSAYEFFRNDKMNAYPFTFGAVIPKPKLRQHQAGGSIGGPIWRNKTFFFGDYEYLFKDQYSNPVKVLVPTAYEESHIGDFSDIGGAVLTAMDPIGVDYFKLFPAPNGTTAAGNPTYTGTPLIAQISHTVDIRIDHAFNPANLFFARYTLNRVNSNLGGILPSQTVAGMTIAPGGVLASYFGQAINDADNAQLDYVHTFTANLVLELKAGYTLINNQSQPLNEGMAINKAFGQPNIDYDATATGLAPVSITNYPDLGGAGRYNPLQDVDNTYQYMGNLTWIHGSHTIKGGAAIIRRQATNVQHNQQLGYWNFSSLQTLLSGVFTNVVRNVTLNTPHYRMWEPSFYVQDDWHAARNLTINAGIRYDIETPFTEAHNHISNFDPVQGMIVVAGVNTTNTAGVQTFYGGIQPRLGFAYTLPHELVVRGGFGLSYFPTNYASNASLKNTPNVFVFGTCTPANCGGYTTLAAGLPLPTTPDYTHPSGSIQAAQAMNYQPAYLEQYNLTIEKAFGPNVLTLSYIGSQGRHMMQVLPDLNAPPPEPSSAAINGSFNSYRPYYSKLPNVTSIGYIQSEGISNYNSMQIALDRRFQHGLSLGTNYAWAHGLDDFTNISNNSNEGYGSLPPQLRVRDYGNASLDMRSRFAFTSNWAIPVGRKNNSAVEQMIRNWQTNVLLVWSTGEPFTARNANNISNTNPGAANTDRPNQSGAARLSPSPPSPSSST